MTKSELKQLQVKSMDAWNKLVVFFNDNPLLAIKVWDSYWEGERWWMSDELKQMIIEYDRAEKRVQLGYRKLYKGM